MSPELLALWPLPAWVGSATGTLAVAAILWVGKRIGDKLKADKAEALAKVEEASVLILSRIAEVRAMAVETNGLVAKHTIQIAILEDRREYTSEARRDIVEAAQVAAAEIRQAAATARESLEREREREREMNRNKETQ